MPRLKASLAYHPKCPSWIRTRIRLFQVFATLAARSAVPGAGSPFAEISDADIDNLFSE
jgi:hypothetical protein